MEQIASFVKLVNYYLWDAGPMIVLLFGIHLFMTFKTGFIQRKVFLGIKLSFQKDAYGSGDVSHFGSLTTALAATIGTGNIIGVGTAIALGGPGAVLWMWLTGVFGIATKYAESLIAVKYRVKTENGTMIGGAMYALERGLKMKWLGALFALFAAIAAFGIGSSVQANAVAVVLNENLNVPVWISGLAISVLLALVIIGGIKSIANVCVKLVPLMTILYVAGCLAILAFNIDYLIPAVSEIIKSAFAPKAAGGGFIAATLMSAARYGIARGLFSNESGMGSAPIVAAAAKTRNPFRQALVASSGTFWDTVVICAITGLVIVSSMIANPGIVNVEKLDGAILTHLAFGQIPYVGWIMLTFGLVTFAFSTILGWSYYGERCAQYLFGPKSNAPYRIIYVITAFAGSLISLNLVWSLADMFNAFMAIPNIIAVLLLSGVIAKETKYYLKDNNIEEVSDNSYN
ncbi:MAG: sodium:alanine symporter family protein [Endomicrobium sp.]|nr:sodium:alanine symporter family protein [Endomicrobium sp.]